MSSFRLTISLLFAFKFMLLAVAGAAQAEASDHDIHDLLRHRNLQDVDTVVIGSDSQTITVTIDQTTLNGLATYGDKIVSIQPAVSGSDSIVSCTATMNSNLVNMQFFLRKFFQPDKDSNGNAQDYDCAANNDNTFIAPDVESCSVTNFPDVGVDFVFGYVAVLDSALNMGATYTINFVCDLTVPETASPACFSSDSTVNVLNKGSTAMKDLAVGDKVLVGDGSYEPVYSFAHRDLTMATEFLQVHTNEGDHTPPLEITEEHLVLANDKYIPARDLQVGDVLTGDKPNKKHAITKIESTTKNGLYAPLTPSGHLIVDGIKASTYVSLQGNRNSDVDNGNIVIGENTDIGLSHHFISHMALSPIRMACMGISSKLCSMPNGGGGNGGYAPFVSFWFELVELFESQKSEMVQILLLVALLAVIAPLYAMESMFGAVFAPFFIGGLVAFMSVAWKGQTKNGFEEEKTKMN